MNAKVFFKRNSFSKEIENELIKFSTYYKSVVISPIPDLS